MSFTLKLNGKNMLMIAMIVLSAALMLSLSLSVRELAQEVDAVSDKL